MTPAEIRRLPRKELLAIELARTQSELAELRSEIPRGVISQLREAFARGNRLAAFAGLCLGGFVPLASWWLAHSEVGPEPWASPLGYLVLGGLIYSAKTVWQWGRLAFDCPWKATGFVLLVEGVLVLSSTPWLSVAALAYLMIINAVATASTLARVG